MLVDGVIIEFVVILQLVVVLVVDVLVIVELVLIQGNEVKGSVIFKVVDGKVYVIGQIIGLKLGSEYGFYIYEKGDCSVLDGMSVGGYFNFGKQDYGNVVIDLYYGGDMFNIKVDDKGVVIIDGLVLSNVNIGKGDDFDIIGRGLIVYVDVDDYKIQLIGNVGVCLVCVVIQKVL